MESPLTRALSLLGGVCVTSTTIVRHAWASRCMQLTVCKHGRPVRIVAALRRVALAHALTLMPLTGNSTQLATPLKETRARSSAGQRAPDTYISSVSQVVSDLSAVARKRMATVG